MKIIDNSNNNTIPLKNIKIGECFKHSPKLANCNSFKGTYMRIMYYDPLVEENISKIEKEIFNFIKNNSDSEGNFIATKGEEVPLGRFNQVIEENVSCVNLADGKTASFDPDVMVIPVSAKVTIENLHLNTEDDLVDEVDNLERR